MIVGKDDPLIALVMFQSAMNLAGVILFIPFLDRFADFLEKRFSAKDDSKTFYIKDVEGNEGAMQAMEKEVLLFIHRIIPLNLSAFHSHEVIVNTPGELRQKIEARNKKLKSYADKYEDLKHTEGELLAFYLKLRTTQNEMEEHQRLEQLIASVRNAIYSAKAMKDVQHNRKEFRDSASDVKYANYKFFQGHVEEFYTEVNELFKMQGERAHFNKLTYLLEIAERDCEIRTQHIYKQAEDEKLNEVDISSLLNTSSEIYSSSKAIAFSLKDYFLEGEAARTFAAGNAAGNFI
jgi:phosphate:Na+ symporter